MRLSCFGQTFGRLISNKLTISLTPVWYLLGAFCIERAGKKVYFRNRGERRSSVVSTLPSCLRSVSILKYRCCSFFYQELKRFPTLASDIAAAANEALERFRDESRKTVLRLVDMESSYLTVEFFRKLHLEPEKEKPNQRNAPPPNADIHSDNHFRKIGTCLCLPLLRMRHIKCVLTVKLIYFRIQRECVHKHGMWHIENLTSQSCCLLPSQRS